MAFLSLCQHNSVCKDILWVLFLWNKTIKTTQSIKYLNDIWTSYFHTSYNYVRPPFRASVFDLLPLSFEPHLWKTHLADAADTFLYVTLPCSNHGMLSGQPQPKCLKLVIVHVRNEQNATHHVMYLFSPLCLFVHSNCVCDSRSLESFV